MRAEGCGQAQRMVGPRPTTDNRSSGGPTLEEPELLSLPDNADSDQVFRDRSTGLPLNPMVKKSSELEMQCMEELKFLEDNACMAETGLPTDWVDINKGDSLRPNYRSRLCLSRDTWTVNN